MLLRNMSPSETTGNSSAAHTQYFTKDAGLQLQITVSAFPLSSHSDSGEGDCFEALLRFACATTCCFACPLFGADQISHPANEDVYFRASDGLITRAVAGYHYSANWETCTGGTLTR
jgi:hypothetical protein